MQYPSTTFPLELQQVLRLATLHGDSFVSFAHVEGDLRNHLSARRQIAKWKPLRPSYWDQFRSSDRKALRSLRP